MNLPYSIVIALFSTLISCTSIVGNTSPYDINLIIPGRAAEGYVIGAAVEESELEERRTVVGNIMNITGIKSFHNLFFDSIIVKNNSTVLFLNKDIITAVAGLKIERRVTSDGVLLSQGSENFISNYNGASFETIPVGNHKVYLFKESGIAIFDDNSDNTIDIYLIFR